MDPNEARLTVLVNANFVELLYHVEKMQRRSFKLSLGFGNAAATHELNANFSIERSHFQRPGRFILKQDTKLLVYVNDNEQRTAARINVLKIGRTISEWPRRSRRKQMQQWPVN